jgi:hypothetical protein
VHIPFGSIANTILHNLGLGNWACLLEELFQLAGTETGRQLLDENGAAIALVPGRRCIAGCVISAATALLITATVAAVFAFAPFAPFAAFFSRRAVVAIGRAGARAATAAVAPAVEVSVGSMTT